MPIQGFMVKAKIGAKFRDEVVLGAFARALSIHLQKARYIMTKRPTANIKILIRLMPCIILKLKLPVW